ncbi:hypothetical protein BC835DRAFT_1507455 [Cytidiella melzeri]|nr:hypothetical protein BC835DRAFT_1507455 [Cytidiella melzeri]
MVGWKIFAIFNLCAGLTSAEVAQYPAAVAYPSPVDFTQLFSKELLSSEVWAKEDWNGITTFARASPLRCFGSDADTEYDVAVLGAPFDTATSYRPGTRFGPNGIRQGSRRLHLEAINVPMKLRISDHLRVVDCGDVRTCVPADVNSSASLNNRSLSNHQETPFGSGDGHLDKLLPRPW